MKLNQLKTAALVLPLALLSGCLEAGSTKESYSWELATPTPAPQSKEITLQVTKLTDGHLETRNEYLYSKSLNQYRIAFNVPTEYASTLQIKRWHNNTHSYEETDFRTDNLGTYGNLTREWLDIGGYSLEPQSYTYQLTYGDGQTKNFDITLKVDLRIEGIVHAADLRTRNLNLDLDTIYITPDSALITDGQSLRLTAKNVLSRGGIFTDEALVGPGFHTQTTGGSIKLDIENLYGSLEVRTGQRDALSNRIQINIKDLSRWRAPESCGISTSMISGYSEPRISIERNRCTGQ